MNQSLPEPEQAIVDENALELIRVWAASGQQRISIATGVWDNPTAWGIMLVDLARHIAQSYQDLDEAYVLELIKKGMDAEWASPTN